MRRWLTTATAAVLALAAATTALGEVNVGDRAPPIDPGTFFNADGVDDDALRGKVVVLQLFHSKSQVCKDQVKFLNGLLETHGANGLVVIATSYEPAADVETFVTETGAKHIVVAESKTTETTYGLVKGHPTTMVIDVNGKVRWKENWADKAVPEIEAALKGVVDRPWVPPEYKDLAALVDGKSYARAGEAIRAKLGEKDLDPKHKLRLEALYAHLREAGKADLETAEKLRAEGKYWEARNALVNLTESFSGLPIGESAAKLLAELTADRTAKREIEARDFYEETWVEVTKLIKEDPTNPKPVIKLLKKVVRKYKGTAAAELAQSKLDRIE